MSRQREDFHRGAWVQPFQNKLRESAHDMRERKFPISHKMVGGEGEQHFLGGEPGAHLGSIGGTPK